MTVYASPMPRLKMLKTKQVRTTASPVRRNARRSGSASSELMDPSRRNRNRASSHFRQPRLPMAPGKSYLTPFNLYLTPFFLAALLAGCATRPPSGGAFVFGVVGDTPYNDREEAHFVKMLERMG